MIMNKSLQGLVSYVQGHSAEKAVVKMLRRQGYKIIAQNVSAPRGVGANELDIVAMDHYTLVFVEVKKRATLELAMQTIDPARRRRLYKAAELFLANNPQYADKPCRFDVIALDDDENMEHLQNVIED